MAKRSAGVLARALLSEKAPVRICGGIRSYAAPSAAEKAAARKEHDAARLDRKIQDSKSFVMNTFRGQVVPDQAFPYPEALDQEQEETLRLLIEPTAKYFAEVNNPAKNDELHKIEPHSLEQLKALGAFGLQVPEEYGGVGLSNTQYARCGEIMGAHDLGIGVTLGAHQSIGFKGILLYGSHEQKKKYLPDLASGKKFAAFSLTEPSSGSDANSIRTRAELSKDKKHYIMNGSKIWITNGGLADVFTVFAQTPVEKDGVTKDKVSAFIVERGFGGVTHGNPENKMGINCSNTCEVFFDNVKVPVENLLGGEGDGFKVAMNILNNGRFGMAAAMSGTMRYCVQKAVEHVTTRVQFGRKLEEFSGILEKIADMTMRHYVTESMAYMISANMDMGCQDYQLEAAISKVYGSESAWHVCDETIQILGGMGFMKEAGLERVLRDLRIFRIFEGTNDILRLFVALTGIQYASGPLKELQKAVKSFNVGALVGEVSKRAGRKLSLSSGPSLDAHVHSSLSDSGKLLCKSVEQFGAATETLLMQLQKKVIDEQNILTRLANASIDIYGMTAALSRASRSLKNNSPTAQHEKLITEIFCKQATERVLHNLGVATSKEKRREFQNMNEIARSVCGQGGLLHENPLGF
jgi:very long chain acyl-CoA dehydrogenase